jgi:A/G-specific adenine glycosylase
LTEFARTLLAWHDVSSRDLPWRLTQDPYKIWLSEIMLQQTRAETVVSYYRAFLNRFPTVEALAGAELVDVLKQWEGLGYYSRARNLHAAAKIVAESGGFPRSAEALRALPGVGQYTAGAIASIAFGLSEPAIDGNQVRVLSRVFGIRTLSTAPGTKRALDRAARAALPALRPGDFNQALMGLGALICTPRPDCARCPVQKYCDAFRVGDARLLPVRPPKADKRVEDRAVVLVFDKDRVLIRRRPDSGLLAGLYEFANFPGARTEDEVLACLAEIGISAGRPRPSKSARHVFTHLIWRMSGWECEVSGAANGHFASADELGALPFPAAFRTYRRLALETLAQRDAPLSP